MIKIYAGILFLIKIFFKHPHTKSGINITDKLYCRSIYASFEKEVETFGIPGKRFSVPEIVLANNTVNEDNKCYCRNKDPNRECFGAGVLDLRSCLFGNRSKYLFKKKCERLEI